MDRYQNLLDASRAGLGNLVPELLLDVFDRLPQPCVLRVAAVCRHWREAARGSHNYYRFARFCLAHPSLPCCHRTHIDAASFFALPDEAIALAYGLKLHITLTTGEESMRTAVVLAIRRSVPLLVGFKIITRDIYSRDILGALDTPAPNLCAFEFISYLRWDEDAQAAAGDHQLPRDLLSSSAPKLRSVIIRAPSLTMDNVRCFDSVRRVVVDDMEETDINAVGVNFPSAEEVVLREPRLPHEQEVSMQSITSLPHLEVLTLNCCNFVFPPALAELLPRATIPRIVFACPRNIAHVAPVLANLGPLSCTVTPALPAPMRVWYGPPGYTLQCRFTLTALDSGLMRVIEPPVPYEPHDGLRLCAHNIRHIEMDDRCVEAFTGAAYPSLEEFIISVSDWGATMDERTPGLRVLSQLHADCPSQCKVILRGTSGGTVSPLFLEEISRIFDRAPVLDGVVCSYSPGRGALRARASVLLTSKSLPELNPVERLAQDS